MIEERNNLTTGNYAPIQVIAGLFLSKGGKRSFSPNKVFAILDRPRKLKNTERGSFKLNLA
jgi:hypothetical protein